MVEEEEEDVADEDVGMGFTGFVQEKVYDDDEDMEEPIEQSAPEPNYSEEDQIEADEEQEMVVQKEEEEPIEESEDEDEEEQQ